MYVRERVVVQAHTKDDGHGAVGQPVGNGDAHAGQEAQGAGGLVPEHRQPGQSLAPGGDHIRNDHQHAQQLLPRNIRADHQPAQNGAQRHRHDDRKEAHHQGVFQRAPQRRAGQLAHQDVTPIIQGEIAHLAAVALGLRAGQGKGGGDHLEQGDHNQAEQDNQADRHDHIERVLYHVQNLIFESGLVERTAFSLPFHIVAPFVISKYANQTAPLESASGRANIFSSTPTFLRTRFRYLISIVIIAKSVIIVNYFTGKKRFFAVLSISIHPILLEFTISSYLREIFCRFSCALFQFMQMFP